MFGKVFPFSLVVLLVFSSSVSCLRRSEVYWSNIYSSPEHLKLTTPLIMQCTDSELKTACFGKNSTILMTFSDWNTNEYSGVLQAVPEELKRCYITHVTYRLLTNSNSIKLHPSNESNMLWTITVTDYDLNINETSALPVNISCSTSTPGASLTFTSMIYLDLAKCKAPWPQDSYITHTLSKQKIKKGHKVKELMFFDDAALGGHHNYEEFIDSKEVSEFFQTNCSYHLDSQSRRNRTVIHCILIARQSKILNETLTFLVGLRNTNPDCFDGNYTGYINVSIQVQAKRSKRSNLFNDSLIFRSAAPYARVTQPSRNHNGMKHFGFELINSKINPFNITSEGIVYVADTKALAKVVEDLRLNISWIKNEEVHFDEVDVKVVKEPTLTCDEYEEENDWSSCAFYKKATQCIQPTSCGMGTGGFTNYKIRKSYTLEHLNNPYRCVWIGDKNPENVVTHLPSTCTPEPDYCPDGVCDSLESLSVNKICPQDCETRVILPARINEKTGRGVGKCNGIVTCDDGGCTCHLDNYALNLNYTRNKDSSIGPQLRVVEDKLVGDSKNHEKKPACDSNCILITTGGTVLVLFAVAVSIFFYRLKMKKLFKNKYVDGLASAEQPFSEYTERNGNSEPLVLNFNMNLTNPFQNSSKPMKVDPKWKFSRRKIITEKVLGEGEFGIVYKAQAYGIAGRPGYTTVAVKTLKDDARKQDFYDLFSEYQLLKGVNHPHVIKLLGVCPADSQCYLGESEKGPFLLIIEYAAYGSLRNYLRRSRHVLAANEPGQANNGLDYNVTPREIMSFARQIASGMSYLSDFKLVHRDLAARNILLDENKVCKISDFGLTRDIYEDNAYFKKSKGRVPVKWMAPESLADHVYTTKSDVWSFGILIWELATLGASPYPGIEIQNLYSLLKQGYRMEQPVNCTSVLYSLMSNCWNIEPEQRPSFHELYQRFDNLLADNTNYLNLTIYNAVGNKSYFSTGPGCDTTPDEKENNLYTNRPKEDKCTDPVENYHPGYVTPIKVPKRVQENPEEYTDMNARSQDVQS